MSARVVHLSILVSFYSSMRTANLLSSKNIYTMKQQTLSRTKGSSNNSGAILKQVDYNSKTWDLVWIVDGKVKEVILTNENRGLCYWRKGILENSTHKMGKLVLQEHGKH
jgi:hypothetical protein